MLHLSHICMLASSTRNSSAVSREQLPLGEMFELLLYHINLAINPPVSPKSAEVRFIGSLPPFLSSEALSVPASEAGFISQLQPHLPHAPLELLGDLLPDPTAL